MPIGTAVKIKRSASLARLVRGAESTGVEMLKELQYPHLSKGAAFYSGIDLWPLRISQMISKVAFLGVGSFNVDPFVLFTLNYHRPHD